MAASGKTPHLRSACRFYRRRMSERPVLARNAELQAIRDFAEASRTEPTLLMLVGEAGIGKTTLWLRAVQAARPGRQVLSSRPAEQDAGTPYLGLADLLHPHLDRLQVLLPARDVATLTVALRGGATPPRALRQAFRAAIVNLASETPVVIAVDDLQWLDGPTRTLLAYALGQLVDEPVGFVAAVRTATAAAGATEDFRRAAAGRARWLNLAPLPTAAVAELVQDRLGVALPDVVVRQVHATSGGNPLFAVELARAWVERGRPSKVPVPASLQALLAGSLSAVAADTQQLLEAVATLTRPSVPRVSLMLGRDVTRELADAVTRGLLNVEGAGTLRFTHPLHASAVEQSTPWSRRRRLHQRATELVDDPIERARHLAMATADPDVAAAAAVESAAEQAAARGAPDTAADLAEHARRLTPAGDRAALHRRSLTLAAYLDACGRFGDAIREIDAVLAAVDAGASRTAALLSRAALQDDMDERAVLLRSVLAATDDDVVRARAHNHLAWSEGSLRLRLDTGADHARRALEAAERAGDSEQQAVALGRLAHLLALAGAPDLELLKRAVPLADRVSVDDRPQLMLALQLMWRGELSAAAELLAAEYSEAVRRGDDSARPFLLVHLCDLAVRRGAGDHLLRHLLERRRLAAAQGEYGGVLTEYVEGLAAVYIGPADKARELAEAGLAQAIERGIVAAGLRLRFVLGLVHLLADDPRRAWDALAPALAVVEECDVKEPGFVPVVPEIVAALVALGEMERANKVAARLDEAVSTGHLWAPAARGRCAGLVLLGVGDADSAAGQLMAARESFDRLGFGFDAARSTQEAGGALRRGGHRRAAQETMDDAVRRFTAIGASAWADRARAELARAGGRRTGQTLTAAEQRVAALVAAGHSNREIAAELFVTVSTVEANLTRVFRKLGVTSRSQLTRLLSTDPAEASRRN